jgi:hypothetical protein
MGLVAMSPLFKTFITINCHIYIYIYIYNLNLYICLHMIIEKLKKEKKNEVINSYLD